MADTKQFNSMVSEIQNVSKQGLTRLAEDTVDSSGNSGSADTS